MRSCAQALARMGALGAVRLPALLLEVLALGALTFATERAARACSCASIGASQLLVGNGQIPSNLGGVAWWHTPASSTDQFALERWNGTSFEPVPAHLGPGSDRQLSIIGPEQPWAAGERYRIAVTAAAGSANAGADGLDVTEIEIVDPIDTSVPLVLSVKTPPVVGPVQVGYDSASCGGSVLAASAQVTLPEPLDAYGSLSFTTRLDGQPYHPARSLCDRREPGASWQGTRGSDLIAAACGDGAAEPRVAPAGPLPLAGIHTVVLEAALPGTSIVWRSNELTLDLRCPAPGEPAAPAQAGAAAADPGAPPTAHDIGADGAVSDDATAAPTRRSDAPGCALSRRRPSAPRWSELGASLIAACGVLRARRRRTREQRLS